MTVPKCGVCQNEDSKYKCPVCELRYCSIACFKQHKETHASNDFPSAQGGAPRILRDRPGTTQRVPKIDFTGFENDAEFQRLLQRYPLLKLQLQTVYGLTLEPGPDDARTWFRQPLYGEQREQHRQQQYAGGRGRGRGRGMRGGRGRGDGGLSSSDRQRGPWTQEKGDKEALSTIQKMRQGAEDDERAEGMREFAELCRLRFATDTATE